MVMCIISAILSCVQIFQGFGEAMHAHVIFDDEFMCKRYVGASSMDVCNDVNVSPITVRSLKKKKVIVVLLRMLPRQRHKKFVT